MWRPASHAASTLLLQQLTLAVSHTEFDQPIPLRDGLDGWCDDLEAQGLRGDRQSGHLGIDGRRGSKAPDEFGIEDDRRDRQPCEPRQMLPPHTRQREAKARIPRG